MPGASTYVQAHINAWKQAGYPQSKNRKWIKFFGVSVSTPDENGNVVLTRNNRILVAKENANDALKKLYFDPKTGYLGVRRLYDAAIQVYDGITRSMVNKFLVANSVHQQHRAKKVGGIIRPIVSHRPFSRWQVDLVDYSKLGRYNNNNNWLLTCIDLFSKYAWVRPMRNKTAETTANHMHNILESVDHLPSIIQTDNGGEFCDAFDKLLESVNIKHVRSSSHTPQTQGAVERFNGTIKSMIARYMTAHQTNKWCDVVNDLVHSYNSTIHRTTKKRPVDLIKDNVSNKDMSDAHDNIIKQAEKSQSNRPENKKLAVGDWVRVSLQTYAEIRRNEKFRKSFERQWSREIYRIKKAVNYRKKGDKAGANTKYYRLYDEHGDTVNGLFHVSRLLYTVPPDQQIDLPKKYSGRIGLNKAGKETHSYDNDGHDPIEYVAERVKTNPRKRKPTQKLDL